MGEKRHDQQASTTCEKLDPKHPPRYCFRRCRFPDCYIPVGHTPVRDRRRWRCHHVSTCTVAGLADRCRRRSDRRRWGCHHVSTCTVAGLADRCRRRSDRRRWGCHHVSTCTVAGLADRCRRRSDRRRWGCHHVSTCTVIARRIPIAVESGVSPPPRNPVM